MPALTGMIQDNRRDLPGPVVARAIKAAAERPPEAPLLLARGRAALRDCGR